MTLTKNTPNTGGLVKKHIIMLRSLRLKVKGKIPSITGLATTAAFNAVEK